MAATVTAEIVKELTGYHGDACLVKWKDTYYAVSSVVAFDTGAFETLVFEADENGEVISWMDVAGGRGMSREEAIADLESKF